MKGQKIFILDTTLRDGQQSPGAGMSFEDNVTYARYAHELGVDVLEAGFPAAGQQDFRIVRTVCEQMAAIESNMTIAALCQLREEQIITTMTALKPSLCRGKARLHTYVPVDPHLMQASLGKRAMHYKVLVTDVERLVRLATENGFEVEFSAEGYSRLKQHFDFTTELFCAAISAGATIINCPDTIGGASRFEGEQFFVTHMKKHAAIIKKEFPDKNIIWSTHCHNDLGLAVENSLTAVFFGPARQIEACINGVGERAGNASLEQCAILIDMFGSQVDSDFHFYTDIQLQKLKVISDYIAERMLVRQSHWPITGDNAARHSSGGHTNAILKNPMAYQPFDPKRVGHHISFVFGPLSGGNHAKAIIEKNGFHCPNEIKPLIAQEIKNRYRDRRKGITDEELVEGFIDYCSPIKVDQLDYKKNEDSRRSLYLKGRFFSDEDILLQCEGENSPLAALDKAVKSYLPSIEIIDYRSNACNGQTMNAKCNSTIIVSLDGANFIGKAVDADITLSAIKAYIHAVNQAYVNHVYRKEEKACA